MPSILLVIADLLVYLIVLEKSLDQQLPPVLSQLLQTWTMCAAAL